MSLATVASPVVDGRCGGCGRFIPRDESHFHSKRKFRGPPRAHIWADGGAMVTRCDDVHRARDLAMVKYARVMFDSPLADLGDTDLMEVRDSFPLDGARVERGRCTVQAYGSEYSWVWYPLADGVRGPGVTTAVVWYW